MNHDCYEDAIAQTNRLKWLESLKPGDRIIYVHSKDTTDAQIGIVKNIGETRISIIFPDKEKSFGPRYFNRQTGCRGNRTRSWIQPYQNF